MSRVLQVSPNESSAYPTIAEAIGDAADDDTIRIAPGEYAESVRIDGLRITLTAAESAGTEGDDARVRITGGDSYEPTLDLRDCDATLQGLVIDGGEGDALKARGGKLKVSDSVFECRYGPGVKLMDGVEMSITDCKIRASQQGIVIEDSSGTIERLEVADSADDAVVIRLGAAPLMRNCTIKGAGNRAVYVYEAARPVMEGCDISGARAGGVLVTQGSNLTLTRCKVHEIGGVGVRFDGGTEGKLLSCTVEKTGGQDVDIDEDATVERSGRDAGLVGVDASEASSADPAKVDALLAELERMVGLGAVKAEVRAIIDEIQVNEWRRSAGLSVDGMSHHLIFAGAPGTGKTTVGRIYGQLLAALGVLPGGPLKEVSRRDLVGQYIGHTAEKTAAVFDEARGGVVFLDEAYTLTRQAGGGNDFGQEAVDMIVKLMEDMRNEIAVIAAGYTQEMSDFLDANPGLASRFVKTVEFENYSADELTLIIMRMLEGGDYQVDEDGEKLLLQHFETVDRGVNFGNARDARKLFEKLRKVQSQRLRTLDGRPTMEQLVTITAQDIRSAVADVASN